MFVWRERRTLSRLICVCVAGTSDSQSTNMCLCVAGTSDSQSTNMCLCVAVCLCGGNVGLSVD